MESKHGIESRRDRHITKIGIDYNNRIYEPMRENFRQDMIDNIEKQSGDEIKEKIIQYFKEDKFDKEKIIENIISCMTATLKSKPSSVKGIYFKKFTISSTMSPGLKVIKSDFIN